MDYDDSIDNNFKVVIRVRPPLPRELKNTRPFQNVMKVDNAEKVITVSENLQMMDDNTTGPFSTHKFTFDHVYDQKCDQHKVYETTAKAVVDSSLSGYNATIFAYGQTGTGKTYTMEGFNSAEERGIIPRAIEQIFKHIHSTVSPRMRFLVRASYLQIYNEVISDLLKPERSNLVIREDKKKGVYVEGLSEWVVRSPQEIYGLMERGGEMRATGSTKMNELSSRSHAVFIIIAEQSETSYHDDAGNEITPEQFSDLVNSKGGASDNDMSKFENNINQSFKVGKLNLVDLAGSERVRLTGATGQRLEESKKINQSLSALGNVIAALTDPKGRQHIPYRDSKLTRILEDSLGGNCKTTMMAMVSPALEAMTESLSTLKFANRAKNIKNEARVNEDLDQKSLLRKYERELKRLKSELDNKEKTVVDKRRMLELDEQRRRAEEDKMAAIRALEARSLEFMKEKEAKRKLEERITSLTSQMLIGGIKSSKVIQDTPAFRSALKEHRDRIRAEYDSRMSELERERESIEEEKAQVDRYKQLLLKQRDIMIALTQRLNERDVQIMALQDELDAYDKHQKELEEKLDEKTAALIHLQRVTMEHNATSPVRDVALADALGDWGSNNKKGISDFTSSAIKLKFDDVESTSRSNGMKQSDQVSQLMQLVEGQKLSNDKLKKELEEAKAEKSSMEYLLREKLETLVQSEIEARLHQYRNSDKELLMHQSENNIQNNKLTMELNLVREELSNAKKQLMTYHTNQNDTKNFSDRIQTLIKQHTVFKEEMLNKLKLKEKEIQQLKQVKPTDSSSNSAELSNLRKKTEAMMKERKAIISIMENKIKVLAESGDKKSLNHIINASIQALKQTHY